MDAQKRGMCHDLAQNITSGGLPWGMELRFTAALFRRKRKALLARKRTPLLARKRKALLSRKRKPLLARKRKALLARKRKPLLARNSETRCFLLSFCFLFCYSCC